MLSFPRLRRGKTELMLSFPRLRRGKDNRQLYSIPDITSFILVYQRDNHNMKKYEKSAEDNSPADFFANIYLRLLSYPNLIMYFSPSEGVGTILKNSLFVS